MGGYIGTEKCGTSGELFGLRAKSVDPLRRRVEIAENVVDVGGHLYFGPPKTRAGRRFVPLPRVASEPLAAHLTRYGRGPEDLVFTAPGGGTVQLNQWRQRFWVPAVRDAGLGHLRPHDFRHTAVAMGIAAGANPKEVATRAGHTSVSFTLDRYGHLFPGSEQRLNDSLDAFVRRQRVAANAPPGSDAASATKTADSGAPIANVADSFAHVARTALATDDDPADPRAGDQGEDGGP